MIAYGSERLTQDCDCAVIAANERMVAAVLQPLGYLLKDRFASFARYAHLANRKPVVDVMLLNEATFNRLYEESREVELDGIKLRAPKPLHLVALKLHALKQAPERIGKDWEDICYLLEKHSGEWTREELSAISERYASEASVAMLQSRAFL